MTNAPRRRARHWSYNTNVDEPAKLLQQESLDVEKEAPAEDSELLERAEPEDAAAPQFEE